MIGETETQNSAYVTVNSPTFMANLKADHYVKRTVSFVTKQVCVFNRMLPSLAIFNLFFYANSSTELVEEKAQPVLCNKYHILFK